MSQQQNSNHISAIRLASDSDVHAWLMSAMSWLLQDHDAVADTCLTRLDREQTLEAWHKVNALQSKLAQRHAYLAEVAVTKHEHQFNSAGMCRCEPTYVDLTQADPVPAGVDGYPIGGQSRNQAHAARALTDECPWCGLDPCPVRWTHDRLDAGSENTWRRIRWAAR